MTKSRNQNLQKRSMDSVPGESFRSSSSEEQSRCDLEAVGVVCRS